MKTKLEQPVPQGKYSPAVRHGDMIFSSGMTPRQAGVLMFSGKIKITDDLEIHRDAVRLAAQNALTASQSCLNDGEKITFILQLNVFLNTEEGFTAHAKVADFASEFLMENIGPSCMGSRAAIGVFSLPSNAPVEITITCKVE